MASILLEPLSLASIAVRTFVLLILTAGIAFAFRRRSAAILHGIWALGLTGCLATPIVMSLWPSWSLPLLPSEASDLPTSLEVATATQFAEPSGTATPARVGNEHIRVDKPPTTTQPSGITSIATSDEGQRVAQSTWTTVASRIQRPSLGTMAVAIWAAGSFAVLLRLLQQMVSVQRYLRQASDLNNARCALSIQSCSWPSPTKPRQIAAVIVALIGRC